MTLAPEAHVIPDSLRIKGHPGGYNPFFSLHFVDKYPRYA